MILPDLIKKREDVLKREKIRDIRERLGISRVVENLPYHVTHYFYPTDILL